MRYYFNVTGVVQERDTQGVDLPSMSDARIRAVKFAAEYLRDRPEIVWMGEEFRVEVCDASKDTCFTFIAVGVDAPAKSGRLRI